MTGRRSPPKAALWLLLLLGANPVREAMIGDILERFVQGRSRLWFWKEIAAALSAEAFTAIVTRRFVGACGAMFSRRNLVKRMASWLLVIAGAFSLGYYTARSPFIMREEMPSGEVSAQLAELRRLVDREQEKRHTARVLGTVQFLQAELKRAEARYAAEPTAELRQARDRMRHNLERARQHLEK